MRSGVLPPLIGELVGPAAALAGFFVTFMNGLRVAAKTDPDERTLTQRVQVALTVLD